MKNVLFSVAVVLAMAARGATYYVDPNEGNDSAAGDADHPFKTVSVALAKSDAAEVVLAEGTYPLTAQLAIDRAITLRGSGRRDQTILDGQGACRGLSISHSDAVVTNLTVDHCQWGKLVYGVSVAISAGKLCGCRISRGYGNSHNTQGGGVYLSGTAVVSDCLIEKCASASASKSMQGVAVYMNGKDAVLERTVIANNWLDRGSANVQVGAVYVAAGTVRNCTITKNRLYSGAGLCLADSADAKAYDTISWGNVDWNDAGLLAPNLSIGSKAAVERLCAPVAAPNDPSPITDDPLFTDAANDDFTLRPSSPCIAHQVGAVPYDTTVSAFGLAATRRSGVDSLETTLSVIGFGGATAASVAWTVDGVGAGTSPTLTKTLSPGFHDIAATVTPASGSAVTVTESQFVKVYATTVYVDASCATPEVPYDKPANAAKTFDAAYAILATNGTMHLASGTYVFSQEYHVHSPQRFIGDDRETVILKPLSKYRHFNICHPDCLLTGVKVTGGIGGTSRHGSALYMSAGVVSNCLITGNSLATGNLRGGAAFLDGGKARITRSVISKNSISGGSGSVGMAVYMLNGLIDNCLVVTNTTTASNKAGFQGGGVYMSGGKVVNCTFAKNECGDGPGVYAAGGTVANTILFDNTKLGSGDDNWGGTSSCYTNCCTKNEVGANCVTVTDAPYEADYSLALGSACIDKGDDDAVDSDLDYFGETRILGQHVDIGAAEYRPSAEVSVSVSSSPLYALPGDEIVSTASVEGSGIDPELCTYNWTVDEVAIAATGRCITNTFGVGRHTIATTVRQGEISKSSDPVTVTVYPTEIHVSTNGLSTFPYDSEKNGFTNLAEAIETALAGMTIRLGEGRFRLYAMQTIDKRLAIVGAGMDRTTVYRQGGGNFRLFELNAVGMTLSDLALTGGIGEGGGVYAHDGGGLVERCRIYGCKTPSNSDGAGVFLSGSRSKIRYSVITNNQANISSGQSRGGGGVKLSDGGICENCLISGNKAQSGSGVWAVSGSRLSNCTLIGNACDLNRDGCAGGAVYATASTVENCIILGSTDNKGSANPHATGGEGNYFNCFLPVAYGTNCVVGTDAKFVDAAAGDYRLVNAPVDDRSPCYRAGRFASWMLGETDFFGNSRCDENRRRKQVDIGYHQSGWIEPGLHIIVR